MIEQPDSGIATLSIVDAHVHFFDSKANVHTFLDQPDETFEALVGVYSALPRRYLLDAYRADSRSCNVKGVVSHEYLSQDPVEEMRWMQRQAAASPVPQAIVALVDFLDPGLEERLEVYRSLPNITAIREHLGWDAGNPKRRLAKRPDLLADPAWRRGLASLRPYDFKCGLEVFSEQLPELLQVVRLHSGIGFTVVVLGWPLDHTLEGFDRWKRDLRELARCENTCGSISAVECVFGMDWTLEQVRSWLLSVIELFGPSRCMFGSHMPISGLSYGFERLYQAYQQIVADFSVDEQNLMFRSVAEDWFRVQ